MAERSGSGSAESKSGKLVAMHGSYARRQSPSPAQKGEVLKLLVKCDDWAQFGRAYATDLERGALFVPTDWPCELLERVTVQLLMPEGHAVELTGRVVHVLPPDTAAASGRVAGAGVELDALDPVRRAALAQLVAFGRDRASGATDMSLGAFLAERAPSLRPEQLAEAIERASMPPSAATGVSMSGVSISNVPVSGPSARVRETGQSGVRPAVKVPSSDGTPPSIPAPMTARPRSSLPAPSESLPAPDGEEAWHATRHPDLLREAMTHLAHRRYREAAQVLRDLAKADRRDRDAYKWYFVARAKQAIAQKEDDRAAVAYERVLRLDPQYREAREFLRLHARRRRLSVIPFSKYFSK